MKTWYVVAELFILALAACLVALLLSLPAGCGEDWEDIYDDGRASCDEIVSRWYEECDIRGPIVWQSNSSGDELDALVLCEDRADSSDYPGQIWDCIRGCYERNAHDCNDYAACVYDCKRQHEDWIVP